MNALRAIHQHSAYTAVTIKAEHSCTNAAHFERRVTVQGVRGGKKIGFFIMIGHSFGLISAVYNYNRRSAILNEILNKIFNVPATFYYDDKFGIETEMTIRTADACVANLHKIAGCDYDDSKRYVGATPTILGVTYDLVKLLLQIGHGHLDEVREYDPGHPAVPRTAR